MEESVRVGTVVRAKVRGSVHDVRGSVHSDGSVHDVHLRVVVRDVSCDQG